MKKLKQQINEKLIVKTDKGPTPEGDAISSTSDHDKILDIRKVLYNNILVMRVASSHTK